MRDASKGRTGTSLADTAMHLGVLAAAAIACALTGGLLSPFVAALAAAIGAPLLDPSATRGRWVHLGVGAALAGGLVLLPETARGVVPSEPYASLLSIASITTAVIIVLGAARRVRSAQARAANAMDHLRDERLSEALAQARRLQSVGAKVAHELKNPLAAIKGLVQLVGRSATDERAQERIGVVQTEIERMEIILGEYLSYARPLEDLSATNVRLSEVVADVLAVLSARAETGGVRLVASGEAPVIKADRRRLKEALLNLVSNAIEATPRGGRVAVSLAPDGDAGARIEVADTGRGIPASDMARLGQSYFTTREGGTGLGFVLAKGAIEQHGGTLEVSSEVGSGTTMRVRLLRAPPGKDEEAKANG